MAGRCSFVYFKKAAELLYHLHNVLLSNTKLQCLHVDFVMDEESEIWDQEEYLTTLYALHFYGAPTTFSFTNIPAHIIKWIKEGASKMNRGQERDVFRTYHALKGEEAAYYRGARVLGALYDQVFVFEGYGRDPNRGWERTRDYRNWDSNFKYHLHRLEAALDRLAPDDHRPCISGKDAEIDEWVKLKERRKESKLTVRVGTDGWNSDIGDDTLKEDWQGCTDLAKRLDWAN